MNKKGDTQWYLIGFILALVVLMVVAFGFFYPKQRALSQETDKLVDITKVDTDFLNIKSFTTQEKEKCAKFTNINECMGVNTQKTGCFWGKTTSGIGCYSCKNNKYFGDDFGKCLAYKKVNTKFLEFKLTCEQNPCDFKSENTQVSGPGKCIFSTIERPDLNLENTHCF